jgi:two-component system, NarL family, response regulator LiaR
MVDIFNFLHYPGQERGVINMTLNNSSNPTCRELQILKLVATGSKNKEIARQLNLSERTVEAHLKTAYRKLEVTSRAGAVSKALKIGWIS